ncbi:MAG: hypothetical protein JWN34_1490 [Bryobacterales bacterium]|jgi:hypothetical protein|nr:hypothetical protein [Bryobacterales bacterium]
MGRPFEAGRVTREVNATRKSGAAMIAMVLRQPGLVAANACDFNPVFRDELLRRVTNNI